MQTGISCLYPITDDLIKSPSGFPKVDANKAKFGHNYICIHSSNVNRREVDKLSL